MLVIDALFLKEKSMFERVSFKKEISAAKNSADQAKSGNSDNPNA